MKSEYTLILNDEFRFHYGRSVIEKYFNESYTIVTLNFIREAFGLKPIRAEYEMCFGPDTGKSLDIQEHYDFEYDSEADKYYAMVVVKILNVVDLRQYYECDDNKEDK